MSAWSGAELASQVWRENAFNHGLVWNVTTPQIWIAIESVWADGWRTGVDTDVQRGYRVTSL